MKVAINLVLAVCLIANSFAQKNQGTKGTQMVELPDTVKSKLVAFLSKQEEFETPNKAVYVFNLVNVKDYSYKKGIYAFKLMGPHFQRRVFINTGKEIKIFDGYFIDDMLNEFTSFCKTSDIPAREKIVYLKAIAIFLQEEYETENN
jgi:hypothetical protein